MRAVLTLALFYVSFSAGEYSPYRSSCRRIGNFSVRVKGKDVLMLNIMIFKETFPPFLHFAVFFPSKMKEFKFP